MPVTKIVPRHQVLNGLRYAKFHRTPYGRMKSRLGGRIGARNQPREAKVMGARRRNELYGNPGTPEGGAKGARRYNELYGNPGTPEGRAKGGRNQPREAKVENAHKTNHLRWHRNRNYFKNDCSYCWKEL